MKLEGIPQILDFDPFAVRTEDEATHTLGEAIVLSDWRIFRYAQVGAAAITRGKLQQAAAPIANHVNMTTVAAALGATIVNVTPGATAGAANLYSEGYLGVNDVDGEGGTYKVKSHPAIVASTAFDVTLFDPIRGVALTANSQTTLVHNAYKNVIESTVNTTRPSGVPVNNAAISDFCWVQTKGVASVLCDTATTLGAPQMNGAVAGSVTDMTDILGASSQRMVGWADIMAGVDTEYRPITLLID